MAAIRGTYQPRFKASLPNLSETQHPSSGGTTIRQPLVAAGRSAVPSQGLSGGGLGAFAGLAHTVQRGIGDAAGIASGVWRAAHGPQGQQTHFAPNGRLIPGHEPGFGAQLNAVSGYRQVAPWVEHPLRMVQREQQKAPQAKANDALLAHLMIGGGVDAASAVDTGHALGQGFHQGTKTLLTDERIPKRLRVALAAASLPIPGPIDNIAQAGLIGYMGLRHRQSVLDALGVARDAYGATRAAQAERNLGRATTRATFKGDLSGERFLHGNPTALRFGIKDFAYSKRNPSALLGSGVYSNSLPERAGQYAVMSPSSKRNMSNWFQARFKDEQAARAFAKKQVQLGNEVDGYVADPHFVDNNNPSGLVGPLHQQRFTNVVKRVSLHDPTIASETDIPGGMRFSDGRVAPDVTVQPGHKAQIRLGMKPALLSDGRKLSSSAQHFVVNYRKGLAPGMMPLGVKPGTRLFDMNAPLDPGEARQAKQLLLQQLRIARAARVKTLGALAGLGWPRTELHEDWFQPHHDDLHELDTMDRLARLRAAGRAGIGRTGTFGGPGDIPYVRDAGPVPPTGRDLHSLLASLLGTYGHTAQNETVARNTQHIIANPNAILRRMGYHGLIEPEFSHGGGIGKEVVMFDKNRFEPFYAQQQRLNPYVRRPVGVRLAQDLSRNGADLIHAIKMVRQTPHGQSTLPLSDELHLNLVNINGKVRFFVAPAQHPDAVGQEINGVQALNLAHRTFVQRKGGALTNNDLWNSLGTPALNTEDAKRVGREPLDQAFLTRRLGMILPDLADRGARFNRAAEYREGIIPAYIAANDQAEAKFYNPLPKKPSAEPRSMDELVARLKQQGRRAESPNGLPSLKHTMNSVRVPNDEYLNFAHSTAEKTHGMPLTSFPEPPKAHEFFSHGTLATLIDGLTPKQADEHIQNLERNLAEAWYKDRLLENSAPHIAFPRMPLRKGYPSFGGLAPTKGLTGRAPYTLGPGMEPLQRAMKLASQHNLRGKEAALFIREYLKKRRGL